MWLLCTVFDIQMQDERTIIGKALFKKETKIEAFVGLKVELSTGEVQNTCDFHVIVM